MKTFIIISTLLAIVALVNYAEAGNEKKTISFKVYGNCEMCKKNIETALELKGIKLASWNKESKLVEVIFNPSVISEDQIHEAIAQAGYDTEKIKAKDEDYNRLHTCCQYRRN